MTIISAEFLHKKDLELWIKTLRWQHDRSRNSSAKPKLLLCTLLACPYGWKIELESRNRIDLLWTGELVLRFIRSESKELVIRIETDPWLSRLPGALYRL